MCEPRHTRGQIFSSNNNFYAFDLIELNGDDPQRDPLEVQQGHACERAEQRESLWNSDAPHGWVLLVGHD